MSKGTDGKFVKGNAGGPGRGNKKELLDRYRRDSTQETAQALVADMASLEASLAEVDAAIAAREAEYIESIAPLLKEKASTEVTLSRCRVAVEFLRDPVGFGGYGVTPQFQAFEEHRAIVADLRAAEQELTDTPDPGLRRAEAIGDHESWCRLRAHEIARDRVDALRGAEIAARRKAERLGNVIAPLVDNPVPDFGGNGRVRGANVRREMLAS